MCSQDIIIVRIMDAHIDEKLLVFQPKFLTFNPFNTIGFCPNNDELTDFAKVKTSYRYVSVILYIFVYSFKTCFFLNYTW